MAMSSYMVNSKYVDPKFPPCEEYSQNSYIPEQSPGYYSPSQDTDVQHPGIYSRSNYSEQPYSCNTGSSVQPRGHVQDQASHPSPYPAQTEKCPAVHISGPRTCGPQQNTKSQNGIPAKLPAVVYPWMKKVHITTGKIYSIRCLLVGQPYSAVLVTAKNHWVKYLWVPLKGPPITPAINFYCLGNRPLAILATIAVGYW